MGSSLRRRLGLALAGAVMLGVVAWAGSEAIPVGASSTSGVASAVPVATVSGIADQTMAGFGASGAWWPEDLAAFSPSVRAEVGRLLFSPSGLELSQYRYNIGAGGVGVTDRTKAPPTFLVAPGVYNWSADPDGMMFLKMAASYGVADLVGFANSAPAPWTSNHQSCGGQLVAGDIPAYAGYLAAVAAHLSAADGVRLSYISPMNEPDTSQSSCTQEGMAVPVDERGPLVRALGEALAAQAPFARVIADESSQVGTELIPELPGWLGTPGTVRWVAAIAHHTYDFPSDATLRQAAKLAQRFHRPLWATEICCYDGSDFGWSYDPGMGSGLWLADTIWADLTQAHDAAFDWWTALSPNVGCEVGTDPACARRPNVAGRNDGLVYYDPNFRLDHDQQLFLTKRYWVLANFSRYVRPGAVLHEVWGMPARTRAVAFEDRTGWVVVVVNDSSSPNDVIARLRFPGPVAALQPVAAYETSPAHDLAPVDLPQWSAGSALLRVPPLSVTTALFARLPAAASSVVVGRPHQVAGGSARTMAADLRRRPPPSIRVM